MVSYVCTGNEEHEFLIYHVLHGKLLPGFSDFKFRTAEDTQAYLNSLFTPPLRIQAKVHILFRMACMKMTHNLQSYGSGSPIHQDPGIHSPILYLPTGLDFHKYQLSIALE